MSSFSIDNMQRLKRGVHIAQAVFIFIAWCITIGVFRGAFLATSAPVWYFVLCFLTVPAIIYQTMTLMFDRSRKWANPYAFAIIDIVYTILWLSAFSSVAAYNTTMLCFGACDLSKATVGLGFFIFVFFCITSAMSVYGLLYFRRNGSLPGGSKVPTDAAMIDPDRDAFSTAPHDDEYAPVQMNDKDGGHHDIEAETSGSGHYDPVSYDNSNVRGYMPPSIHDTSYRSYGEEPPTINDTSYRSYGEEPPTINDASYRSYGEEPPSHMDYGDIEAERVRFPMGNYN